MKFSKVFLASLLAVVVGGIATTLFFLFAGVGMIASLGATPELRCGYVISIPDSLGFGSFFRAR